MHTNQTDLRKLRRTAHVSLYWVFGTNLPSQLISWIITILIARILSPSDYGLMGMAMLLSGFLMLFNEVGLGPAIVQKSHLSNPEVISSFWLTLCVAVILSAVTYFSAPLVSTFFSEPRLINMVKLTSVNFLLSGLYAIPYNLLCRELAFGKTGVADFLSRVSNAGSALLFAMNGFGAWSLLYGILIGQAVKLVCCYLFMPWAPKLIFSYGSIRQMMTFGIKVAADRLLWFFYSSSDIFIAGKLLGKTPLGYYSMAMQLASMPIDKVVFLFKQIAFPMFSKIQEDTDLLKAAFIRLSRNTAFVTFPLFSGMAAVSDTAISVILTDKWIPMLFTFKILCFASGIRALSVLTDPLVLSRGRPGIGVLNTLLCSIVMPVSFLLGSGYGLEGLAMAWLTVYPLLFLIMMKRSLQVIDLSLPAYLQSLVKPLVGTAFMFFTVNISDGFLPSGFSPLLKLLIQCSLGFFSYMFFIIVFAKDFLSDMKALINR